jgi:hypothetical protein
MPRVIHMPLSGGDRKALAKQLRQAEALHREYSRQAAIERANGEGRIRRADRLECDAWNALLFLGILGDQSPTIAQAINAGCDRLEVRCDRCARIERVDIGALPRSPATMLHTLEPSLFCAPCSQGRRNKVAAHILCVCPEINPEPPITPHNALRGAKRSPI